MEIKTTRMFWNCKCEQNQVHPRAQASCDRCGVQAEKGPDSRIEDVLELFTKTPWQINPDFDQYGFYNLSQAAEEQKNWVNEGINIGDEEGERRQEIVNLHDANNARLMQTAPAFFRACLEALEYIDAGKTYEAGETLSHAISMLDGIGR